MQSQPTGPMYSQPGLTLYRLRANNQNSRSALKQFGHKRWLAGSDHKTLLLQQSEQQKGFCAISWLLLRTYSWNILSKYSTDQAQPSLTSKLESQLVFIIACIIFSGRNFQEPVGWQPRRFAASTSVARPSPTRSSARRRRKPPLSVPWRKSPAVGRQPRSTRVTTGRRY